jgi:cobalt-zinc-cadmium efflux system membrane fusion protein
MPLILNMPFRSEVDPLKFTKCSLIALAFATTVVIGGCGSDKANPASEAPPPAQVEREQDGSLIRVDHPEQFPLATAVEYKAVPALNVTGLVQPDIARAVPVISLAAGRVVEIKARLGDVVKKGQLLLRVRSTDVSIAYQVYLKAVNDERLARQQVERSRELYAHGAASKGALEQAEDAEQDAKVDLDTATEQLRLLGVDKDHPSGIVDVVAPISGVITEQLVTNAAGVQGLSGPNPFTISDLSYVWIMCDVYENDLDAVHLGEYADIRLNAYPDRVLKGRIDNILPILDPSIRTAKVRLELLNPGQLMRVGMFVTATFYGKSAELRAAVPSSAILHLHDRDWVFVATRDKAFRRVEITGGVTLPENMQEVISGIKPGTQLIQSALTFQNTVEQ